MSLVNFAASPPRIRIDIVFDGVPMPTARAAAAAEEVRIVWAPYGVDIRVRQARAAARADAIQLRVRLANRDDPRLPGKTLGSIEFHGDAPGSSIVLYTASTSELVSAALIGHLAEWPPALHDRVLGRVLGRALAHEIGHFLLRTQQHSAKGLMRARQLVPDLMREDRGCCALSATDVSALNALIVAATRESSE